MKRREFITLLGGAAFVQCSGSAGSARLRAQVLR
jgi:hypothetical protein